MEYSKEPTILIRLDDHFDIMNLKAAIDNIKPSGNVQVRTDEVIKVTLNKVFSTDSGARPSVPKIVILVTDDESTGERSMEEVNKDLESQGARIFVVTIGSNVDQNELKKLVPKYEISINVPDADDLDNITSQVVDVIKTDTKERK